MHAKVEKVGPTPYHQPAWYVVRVRVGNVILEVEHHYGTIHDKALAQKIADKANEELKKEQEEVINMAIELRKDSHKYDPNFRG